MAPIRKKWYERFNVAALIDHAGSLRNVKCVCDLAQKPMCGSSNYAIILIFDDNVEWVFRYPAFVAGQSKPSKFAEAMLASEVATMKYVRDKTLVPVPEIFDYRLTCENSIGVPYLLMSKAEGVQLKTLGWNIDLRNLNKDRLSNEQKSTIMRNLGQIVSKLNEVQFDQIGSVVEKNGKYSVGECLAPPFIFHGRDELSGILRGPFNTDQQYYDALVDVYFRHLEELPLQNNVFFIESVPKERDFTDWSTYHSASKKWALGTSDENLSAESLLDYHTAGLLMRELTPNLVAGSNIPRFSLYHNDLSATNVFVDPVTFEVTCLIDWTNASTVPPASAHATPGLPQYRDGTEPYLEEAFRSSFTNNDENLWKCARWASTMTRLSLLDSGDEKICLENLLTTIWNKNQDEIWALFRKAQRTNPDLIALARNFADGWDNE